MRLIPGFLKTSPNSQPLDDEGEPSERHAWMKNRAIQLFAVLFGLPLFVYSVLALAQAGSGSSYHWTFPKWFGCVIAAHEGLAGGLIGAAGALLAAWIAWTAVQHQISSENERAIADRAEAERLLSEDLTDYAEGMGAAWRLLEGLPEGIDDKKAWPTFQATAFMAEWVSRPERIANYRAMADILGWDRRRRYKAVLSGLEELRRFGDPKSLHNPNEVLALIRRLSVDFEYCLPATS